jgi:Clp amino terminal domain, pathogenicity island component
MIKQLVEQHRAKARDQRYGDQYNPAATYYDAHVEAIRRGDRAIGSEHLLLALLIDPASPAARAIGHDLESGRSALDALDREALSAIGVEPGITAGPVAVLTRGRLRLTPAAKVILAGSRTTPSARRAGLGRVLNALLDLQRPDPAAELLASLGVEESVVRERFAELDKQSQP